VVLAELTRLSQLDLPVS